MAASSRLSAMLHETLGGAVHRRYRPAAAGPSTYYYPTPPDPPRPAARTCVCVLQGLDTIAQRPTEHKSAVSLPTAQI